MAETVETAIYRLQVEGADQIVRLTEHIDNLAVAEESATGTTRVFSQALQNQIARFDETVRGQENIRKALESYERYAEAGLGTQQQLAAYYEITNQKVAIQTQKLNELAVATENARRAQANVAAGPGITAQRAGGAEAYAAQFEAAAKAQEEQIASINKLRAAMNPLEEEQGRIAKQMVVYRNALKEGKISQEEYAAASEAAGKSLQQVGTVGAAHINQVGNASKAARYEMINLSRQFQDVGVSLAGGQSPFMVLIQQGSQIYDVFASSERKMSDIFKSMGAGIKSFVVNPITATIALVTALTAATLYAVNAMDKLQVSTQRAISGAGARTGTTVEDVNKFVAQTSATRKGAGVAGLSDTEARKLAEGFTQSGEIVISQLNNMGTAVQGFANKTEISVDKAIDKFVEFGKDPVKAVQALADAFGPLTNEQQKAFDAAKIAGDKTAELNVLMDAYGDRLKKAADNTTWMERRARDLATVFGREMAPAIGKNNTEAEVLAAKLADLGEKARVATEKSLPYIQQLRDLDTEINKLKAAKDAGLGSPELDAALQKLQNEKQLVTETAAEQVRYNQYVAETVRLYGNLTQATALQLRDLQAQLPVIEAVTGAEKMRAQYALDYANALKTLPPADAQALAAAKYEASQAAATTSVKQQVEAMKDSTAMIKAQENGTEATTEASIAYKNAIQSGADSTAAAALYAATLQNKMAGAAAQARQLADSAAAAADAEERAAYAASRAGQAAAKRLTQAAFTDISTQVAFQPGGGAGGTFTSDLTGPSVYSNSAWPTVPGGGINAAWDPTNIANSIANQNSANQNSMNNLTSSVDDLKSSTDKLNATNQELLSPYYTMDPRTSHIGFRSQGMASGGYVDVPGGASANDNLLATIPVASGERIYVDPMNGRRGGSGGNVTINISSPILVSGNVNKDEFGRTLYQSNQQLAKQVRAATQ